MKVSVVTVCYNSEKTVSDTIRSVYSQRGVEIDYLIVDGASTDSTRARIAEATAQGAAFRERERLVPIALTVVSEPDRGMYDALNKGIVRATGDVLGILNSDDVFESDETLAAIAAAFDETVDAVYADIRFVRNGKTARYYSARRWKPWMHRWGFMPPHPSVYIRRVCFERLGLYKLGYRISADFELMVRFFCRGGIRTRYLPRCVVVMRFGGLSTGGLRSNILLNKENVRANRENGTFSCFAMMLPKYAYKILGYLQKRS
jgi:glycosyltransferase involved in cell wall biosynthesis